MAEREKHYFRNITGYAIVLPRNPGGGKVGVGPGKLIEGPYYKQYERTDENRSGMLEKVASPTEEELETLAYSGTEAMERQAAVLLDRLGLSEDESTEEETEAKEDTEEEPKKESSEEEAPEEDGEVVPDNILTKTEISGMSKEDLVAHVEKLNEEFDAGISVMREDEPDKERLKSDLVDSVDAFYEEFRE